MSLVTKKLIWLAAAAALLMSTGANAQELEKDPQNCMNEINKRFSLVAKTKHKEIESCIKNFSKGKFTGAADDCRTEDPKGKVAKQEANLSSGYGKKCVDKGVDLDPPGGFFGGPDMEATAAAEGIDKELRLLNSILGLDLDAAIVLTPKGASKEDKAASGCQLGLMKELYKCQDTKLKEFLSCKKNGLKDGSIVDAATLQAACLDGGIPDPKGKIAKACGDKIVGTATKKCADKGVLLADVFGGSECADTFTEEAEIRVCLETAVECDVCNSINVIDGTSVDCDLFDNGAADLSCGACRNANDQAVFASLDVPTTLCIAGCAGDLGCIEACVGTAFQDPNCGPCIAETFDCTVEFCLAECGADPLDPVCTTCLADNGCLDCL